MVSAWQRGIGERRERRLAQATAQPDRCSHHGPHGLRGLRRSSHDRRLQARRQAKCSPGIGSLDPKYVYRSCVGMIPLATAALDARNPGHASGIHRPVRPGQVQAIPLTRTAGGIKLARLCQGANRARSPRLARGHARPAGGSTLGKHGPQTERLQAVRVSQVRPEP